MRRLLALLSVIAGLLGAPVAHAAQGSGCMPTTGTVSGLAFATAVNTGLAALISSNSGGSAPATDCSLVAVQGQVWLDTSTGTPAWKIYDGTSWLITGRMDLANHLWVPIVGGGTATVASATTTDLCSSPQASLTISGTTTITGFGSSCAVGQIKFLSFSGALTLTNSGTLVLPTGANITTVAGDRAIASQLASGTWALFSYQRASGQPLVAQPTVYMSALNGLMVTNGATPGLQTTVTAYSALIPNAAGTAAVLRMSVNVTCSMSTSGAGGLDSGSVAANTWYAVYIIDNGTTPACLTSTNGSTPTMPGGYTYIALVGWVRTYPGSTSLMYITQRGKRARYIAQGTGPSATLPVLASGTVGTVSTSSTVYSAVSVSTYVPITAAHVWLVSAPLGNVIMVAPNPNYGTYTTAAASPIVNANTSLGTVYAAYNTMLSALMLESTNIYVAMSGGALSVYGWDDQVNAN